MKKIKKFISGLAVGLALLASPEVKADTATTLLTGANSNAVIFTGPAVLLSISVYSTAGTNLAINFYDSPFATNGYYVGAYTNTTKSVATTNILYTNVFGVVSTNSYSVIRSATNTATAGIRTRQLIASVLPVSNTVTTVDFDAGQPLGYGLSLTNHVSNGGAPGGGITISVEYEKLK